MTGPIERSTAVAAAAVLDAGGVVVADVPCRSCSYNLRGLGLTGQCPECGAFVEGSLTDDLFRYASPHWTRGIAAGLALIVGSIIAKFVIGFGGVWIMWRTGPSEPYLLVTLLTLASVVGVLGSWMMSSPNPSGVGADEMALPRRVLRVALLIGLGTYLISFYSLAGLPFTTAVLVQVGLNLFFLLVAIVGEWCCFLFYEHFAGWIPDRKLMQRASVLRWGYCGAMALQVVHTAVLGWYWIRQSSPPPDFSQLIQMVAGIGLLLCGLLMVLLILRLRRCALREAALATEHWASFRASRERDAGSPPPAVGS